MGKDADKIAVWKRSHEEMLREHEAQEMEALDAELAKLEAKSATLVDDFNSTTKNLDAADEYSRQRLDSAANLLEEQAAKLRAKSIANLDAQIAAYEARVARGEMYDSSKGEVIEAKVTTLKRELTRMKSSGKAGTQPTGPSRSLLFVLGVVVPRRAAHDEPTLGDDAAAAFRFGFGIGIGVGVGVGVVLPRRRRRPRGGR